ncbi:MAG: hypothetical protein U0556_07130 [Dehalococcoidia bacterium]
MPSGMTKKASRAAGVIAVSRRRRWAEIVAAALLALASMSTAWCAYQSTRWSGERTSAAGTVSTANTKVAKLTNLAMQRTALHADLFVAWLEATNSDNRQLADFLFARFPEPLLSATRAWQATSPWTNPAAPLTPFAMAEYVLPETVEATRWEAAAEAATAQVNLADQVADRYVAFTVIFAAALFFGGISGKFSWPPVDYTLLGLGVLVLLVGASLMAMLPVA